MITKEIIKIASDTKNIGLTNNYNFKSSLKNSICGDKIKLELTIKNLKINKIKSTKDIINSNNDSDEKF